MSPAIGNPSTGDARDSGDTDRFAVYRAWPCDPRAKVLEDKAPAKARNNPRTVTATQHHDGETACSGDASREAAACADRARLYPTAKFTIEALLYELRGGLSCRRSRRPRPPAALR
jgi:hypothetical protein